MTRLTSVERLGFAVCAARWLDTPLAPAGILSLLVSKAPETVSHEQLSARGGVRRPYMSPASVKVQVCHLRAALEDIGASDWIEGSWGEGYRFVGDVDAVKAAAERFA